MNRLRAFYKRIAASFRRDRRDDDLAAELESHLEFHIEDNLHSGMSPAEARRQALIKLGGLDQTKEAYRDRRGLAWLDSLLQDIRFALRMLRKNPGFTAIAILTLALGIGANTAIFSAINGILIEPLAYRDSARLVTVGDVFNIPLDLATVRRSQAISIVEAKEIQAHCTAFDQLALYNGNVVASVRTPKMPDQVGLTGIISDNFFPMLGVKPILGRVILPSDLQPVEKHVAVASYRFWQDDLGASAGALSATVVISGQPYEIVGVMPPEFTLGTFGGKGLWIPEVINDPFMISSPEASSFIAIAHVAKGTTLAQANAQLAALSTNLAAQYPKQRRGFALAAIGIKDDMVGRVRSGLLILFAAVGLVLLIACVNVGALLIARAWTRQGEIVIREALGATRFRVIRQLFTESFLLSFTGGAGGLLVTVWGVRVLRAIAPRDTPRLAHVTLAPNVFFFTLAICFLAPVLFGLVPALHISRRARRVSLSLGTSEAFAPGSTPRRHFLRSTLVAVEVSLAVVLVLAAALMVRSFERLIHVDTGIRTDHILTFTALFSHAACNGKDPEECNHAATDALDSIRAIPGVQLAAISNGFPLQGQNYKEPELYLAGEPGNALDNRPRTSAPLDIHSVTPDYFPIFGIPLLEGRNFNDADLSAAPNVAIVNRAFVRDFLTGNPLGRRFATSKKKSGDPDWMQIVGVVGDDRDLALQTAPGPIYYIPGAQGETFAVRTSIDPMASVAEIQKRVWAVDPNAPVRDVKSLDQTVAESVALPRFQTSLLAAFGSLGLLLAIVGIYGVMSHSVAQRTHEIGVRMALGASPSAVMQLVIGEGARLAVAGVACGLVASWALTRFIHSLLFEIAPTDPSTSVGVSILLLLVAIAACYIPARRAMRVDPMVALRHE